LLGAGLGAADDSHDGAHGRTVAGLYADVGQKAILQGWHFHRHLVRLNFEQDVAGGYLVPDRLEPFDDLALVDRLAELRHQDVHVPALLPTH